MLHGRPVERSAEVRVLALAAKWLFVGLMLLLNGAALADESDDYDKQTWATFHHLVDHRDFRPSSNSCAGKAAVCQDLLSRLAKGDFQFLAPIEHGDTPRLPTLVSMRRRCPGIGVERLKILTVPLKPASGFALYRVPESMSPVKSESVYLSRNEDYRDASGVHVYPLFHADGTFSTFTYPGCKRLKEVQLEKTHKSTSRPDAPNQETASMAEPIVIAGRVLIMIIKAYNPNLPTDSVPLYSLVLWSIVGNARTDDELYQFVAR